MGTVSAVALRCGDRDYVGQIVGQVQVFPIALIHKNPFAQQPLPRGQLCREAA